MFMLWASLAGAAPPELVSDPGIDPGTSTFVEQAFRAGEACAGRPPDAEDTVRLAPLLSQTYGGLARFRNDRLFLIEIAQPHPRVLLHEVAHGWSHGSPIDGFVEGGAEVLANCMAMRLDRRDLRLVGGHRKLATAQSIRKMEAGTTMMDYHVSRIWFGSLADRVGLQALLARDARPPFPSLKEDPHARAIFAAYDNPNLATVSHDADEDGVPAYVEQIMGTDPNVRDTDGDGWWDGARPDELPPTATHIQADGNLHCSGHVGPAATVTRRSWNQRDPWGTWVGWLETPDPRGRIVRGVGTEMALWPVRAAGWRPDRACAEGSAVVVLATQSWVPRTIVHSVARHLSPDGVGHRTVVRMGAPQTTLVNGEVWISARDVRAAQRAGASQQLPVLVEAMVSYAELDGLPTEQRLYEHMTFLLEEPPAWRPSVSQPRAASSVPPGPPAPGSPGPAGSGGRARTPSRR